MQTVVGCADISKVGAPAVVHAFKIEAEVVPPSPPSPGSLVYDHSETSLASQVFVIDFAPFPLCPPPSTQVIRQSLAAPAEAQCIDSEDRRPLETKDVKAVFELT